MTIGEKIKTLRLENNWSQKDLSKQLDLKQSTVANYEKDVRTPNVDILVKLADVFKISMDEMVGYELTGNQRQIKIDQFVPLADHFLNLILHKRVREAKDMLDDLMTRKSLEEVFFKLFRIALTKLGWLWEIEEITISEEHYVSYEISKMITQMTDDVLNKQKVNTKNKRFVGMAVPGEKHNIGLKMTLAVLETKGYETTYIGDAVPMQDLIQFLEMEQADVLILSITSVHFQDNLREILKELPNQKIAVAGLGTSGLTLEADNLLGCFKRYDTCMEALL
jgi:transcriptional regulator with XRE-family HTH domain